MNIDIKEELRKLKEPVWKEYKKYLPLKEPEEHYRMVREYPERQGKYLRPGLVMLSTDMHGGNPNDAILTAAAMQSSEDWLLIHDDFQDHSEERRHKPSLNVVYGDELSVNAGDALHLIMWKMLGDNVRKLGDNIGWKIYDKMYDILMKTSEGQYMEINWIVSRNMDVSEEEYFAMVDRKTCNYTITGPLQLGAIVAGIDDADEKIEAWGTPFGRGFQIWDDVMNLVSSTSEQGKERGGDILEGKRTLILIHLLNNCSPIENKQIRKIYSKNRIDKTVDEKDYVLKLMEEYGSIEYAAKIAKEYANKAKSVFEEYSSSLPGSRSKEIIKELIDFVVSRKE